MRTPSTTSGFTLIELMIVIAIIAIIAAIAIPSMLESRISANESAASASLRAGVFPAQSQFAAGTYSDMDSNGRGEFATNIQYLAGATASAAATGVNASTRPFQSMSATFNVADGVAVGAYAFQVDTDLSASVGTVPTNSPSACFFDELYWVAFAAPVSVDEGRRGFSISQNGTTLATKATVISSSLISLAAYGNYGATTLTNADGSTRTKAAVNTANHIQMWATCPWVSNSGVGSDATIKKQ